MVLIYYLFQYACITPNLIRLILHVFHLRIPSPSSLLLHAMSFSSYSISINDIFPGFLCPHLSIQTPPRRSCSSLLPPNFPYYLHCFHYTAHFTMQCIHHHPCYPTLKDFCCVQVAGRNIPLARRVITVPGTRTLTPAYLA